MGAHPVSLLSLPRLLGLLGLAGLVLTPAVAAAPRAAGPATMVQLTKSAACTESVALTRAGAREIDGPLRLWRLEPALAASAVPALHVEQGVEQLARREVGLDGDGAVQEAGLLDRSPRLRLAQRGDAHDVHSGELVHERDRPSDRVLAVPQIRTEPDVGTHERTVACPAGSGS